MGWGKHILLKTQRSTFWVWNPAPTTGTTSHLHLTLTLSTVNDLSQGMSQTQLQRPSHWVSDNIHLIHLALCGFGCCFKQEMFLLCLSFSGSTDLNAQHINGKICYQSKWNIYYSVFQEQPKNPKNKTQFCIKYNNSDICTNFMKKFSTNCSSPITLSKFIELGMYDTFLQEWITKYKPNNKSLFSADY